MTIFFWERTCYKKRKNKDYNTKNVWNKNCTITVLTWWIL